MRRLRLQGQNERLLREAVRGILEGIADASPAEAERMRQEIVGKLPQGDTTDNVIAGLGFTSDIAGSVLNLFDKTWWGKPINMLSDAFSLMFATMQFSRAIGRYREVYVDTDLSALSPDVREDVLFVYKFDYRVAQLMWFLSMAGFAASVAQVAGWKPGTGLEVLLKAVKWGAFGVSILDVTSGVGASTLAITKRIEEINKWVNGPQFTMLIENGKSALDWFGSKSGQTSLAAATAKLVLGGEIQESTIKKCLDTVMTEQQRDELLDWLSTIKVEAADRAK